MNYFYSIRRDKRGNPLMTSYGTKVLVEKHGEGGKVEHTVYYLNPENGYIGNEPGPGRVLLRSFNRNDGERKELETGEIPAERFMVVVQDEGRWRRYGTGFPNYGQANSTMKSISEYYEAAAVIDVFENAQPVKSPAYTDEDDLSIVTEGKLPWK